MKTASMFLLMALLPWVLFAECTADSDGMQFGAEPSGGTEPDEATVSGLVEEFGRQLRMVSFHDPRSMEEHYQGFVSPELLAQWLDDPTSAPGKLTSSPWPDRIDILHMEFTTDDVCEIEGEIIEITSTERDVAAKRPINLLATRVERSWVITDVVLGPYE